MHNCSQSNTNVFNNDKLKSLDNDQNKQGVLSAFDRNQKTFYPFANKVGAFRLARRENKMN